MRIVAALFLILPVIPLHAQHDGARNAVQFIAKGQFDKVDATLAKKKPFAGDAESRFVEMLSLLAQDKVELAFEKAKAAKKAGLPIERLDVGPREELEKLHSHPPFAEWRKGFSVSNIIHGPMLGTVTDHSASFWIRTREPTDVVIKLSNGTTGVIRTKMESDYTGVLTLEGLKPDTEYDYEVGSGKAGSFKTSPRNGSSIQCKVAFGGGAGYVPEWERMWDTILAQEPGAMLMLGDNVYIDQPEHSLAQYYCYYRRQSRPEWKRFIATTAIYSIWDDHDFGTNDCVPGPEIDSPKWKRPVWNVFRQNWVNPSYGGGETQPGCWYDFMMGDVHFMMLDGRYYRDRKGKTMLGPVQKEWLLKTLSESEGTFKVLVSPVPFTPGIKPGSKDPWDGFPEEREEIFSLITKNKIDGVFLVAADRHRTDLRKIERPGGYPLYEFESSRLTNHHTHKVVQTDGLVWGYNKTCSFGLMEFDTSKTDPEVILKCITIDGVEEHQHLLKKSELTHP